MRPALVREQWEEIEGYPPANRTEKEKSGHSFCTAFYRHGRACKETLRAAVERKLNWVPRCNAR